MPECLRRVRSALPHTGKLCLAILAMLLVEILSAVSIGTIQPVLDLVLSPKDAPSFISLPKALQNQLGPLVNSLSWVREADKLTVVAAICGLLLLLILVKGVLLYIHKYMMSYVAEHVMMDVRNDLYAAIHRLSLGFFNQRSTGEIMSRLMMDVNLLGETVTIAFSQALREPFYILSFGALLLLLQWQLALLCLLVLPLLFIPIARFGNKIRHRGLLVQERYAELNTILQEALTGIRIVKAFVAEEYERLRFARKNQESFRAAIRIARVTALSWPVLEVLGGIGILGVVVFGSYLVLQQILTLGGFMVFLGALISIFTPIKRLGGMNNHIQRGMAGVKRVFELM
ncbi:MAG: ABC transporter transmembrane domain-containing protein, partial [candidate division NC10 bacterium]